MKQGILKVAYQVKKRVEYGQSSLVVRYDWVVMGSRHGGGGQSKGSTTCER